MRQDNKKKKIDFFAEAIDAVELFDNVRLKRVQVAQDLSKLHSVAVNKIEICNNFLGAGTISISKARTLLSARYRREKVKLVEKGSK